MTSLVATVVVIGASRESRTEEIDPATDSPTHAQSLDGVLLLREGGVLTGQISRTADRYTVTRGGSEVSIAVENVEFVGRSLEEAYEARRRRMQPPTLESHLSLAEWCLRWRLHPQAAQELLAARGLEPRHPTLELLERRLAILSQPVPAASPPATTSPSHPPPTQNDDPDPATSWIDEMPIGAVEQFTRRIQPLLVNNCTNAGCHRPGGTHSFELDRALLHGMANRRSTTKNLAEVLGLIDRQRPQASPLLTIPRRDHGGLDHPVFGPRHDRQFQQLVEWVALVTKSQAGAAADPEATDQQPDLPRTAAPPPAKRWREPVKRVAYGEDGTLTVPGSNWQQGRQLRIGAKLTPWRPKDPFDPEIFNRQTRKQIASERN